MTPVQMLAASGRPLVEVLVDRLRAAKRPSPLDRLRHHHGHDDHEDRGSGGGTTQAELPLGENEERAGQYEVPLRPLRPDEVAAAILLGRALDQNRDVLCRLQDTTTVAIIEVPGSDLVDLVERMLREFVLGGNVTIIDGDRCEAGDEVASPGSVILFSRDTETGKKALSQGKVALGAAIQRQAAIIGIAADPDRALPSDLVRLADHRIVLPSFDAEAVTAVIEAITGRKPPQVGKELGDVVTLGALVAGVRADLGAEGSLVRLKRLVDRDRNARPEPTLADLHGLGAARVWGEALVADLRDYKAGRIPFSAVDKGLLLTGAPGTGKTTLVAAIAREAEVFFVATSYSEWGAHREGHLGHVQQKLRQTFAEARQHRPSILFIDEIDTIPARGGASRNRDWWNAILTTLLTEIDGINGNDGNERQQGVVVIGACNGDPSQIDKALLRSGRLDRHIEIPLPDHPALLGIFRTHLGGDLQGADLRAVALAARGRTGADVERYVREARRAARKAARSLALQDLLDAVRGGAPDWPAEVRRRIAHHEAGHCIAELALGTGDPTAISINGGGGLSEASRTETRALTHEYLERHLAALLAGRAAELLVFGDATAGAGGGADSDLARATRLALQIEAAFGLGRNGSLWLGEVTSPRDLLLMPEMRAAVRQTIDTAQAAATELLIGNRPALDALAQALFIEGYLDRAEIDAVLAKAPLAPNGPTPEPPAQTAAPPYVSTEDPTVATSPTQGAGAETTPHRLT